MKRTIILLVLALLLVVLVGCATPTPNVNPAEIAMTMAAQKMDAEATKMRIDIQYTATAQVIEATRSVEGTQAAVAVTEQFRQDAAATDQQFRRDAASTEQRRRNDAAATEQRIRDDEATQQARRDTEATVEQDRQNVIGTGTAQMQATWNAATLQVQPTHDLWTQQAVVMEQALATNKVELSNLNVKQQSDKNTLEWFIPFLLAIGFSSTVILVMIRRSRTKEIVNQETGKVEVVVLDSHTWIRPQLLTGPVLDLRGKTPSVPMLADAETQNEVTRRAQAVEALQAMPTQAPTANAAGMMNSVFSQESKPPVIEVWTPGQVSRVILDELSDQVIEEE